MTTKKTIFVAACIGNMVNSITKKQFGQFLPLPHFISLKFKQNAAVSDH